MLITRGRVAILGADTRLLMGGAVRVAGDRITDGDATGDQNATDAQHSDQAGGDLPRAAPGTLNHRLARDTCHIQRSNSLEANSS